MTDLPCGPAVWTVAPVDEQPELTVHDWTLYEVWLPYETTQPTLHVVGFSYELREGRVSSPVTEIDWNTRRLRTRSGRVYELAGRPGANRDADAVWNAWRRLNAVLKSTNVTKSVLASQRGLAR